ncbi:MAG: hypothetical protein IPM49_06770 [Flavobacteriales bacterium]|nr:hypothetical protein [Flavobacteriales bacterium]
MLRAQHPGSLLMFTIVLNASPMDGAAKCNRYWDLFVRSNGTNWDLAFLNDTLHLSSADTLIFHEVMLGDCPPYFVTHIWNGDTIPLGAPLTFRITGQGQHLIIEERPLEPVTVIASFVIEPTSTVSRECILTLSALLGGAMEPDPGQCCLMRDDLRQAGIIPLMEPYSTMGFTLTHGTGLSVDPQVFTDQVSDLSNVVDWVLLELRDPNDASTILYTKPAFITRSGSVREPSNLNPWLKFDIAPGPYFLALRHRNHLGVMTGAPVPLSEYALNLDMRSPGSALFGSGSLMPLPMAQWALWPGNAKLSTSRQQVKFAGALNDQDAVLARTGGSIPTNTTTGYWPEDTNLDGVVKYSGWANDRDIILQAIDGAVPTSVRVEQLPD